MPRRGPIRRARGLWQDRRGAVGLEFMLILPLLLVLMFGTYEATTLLGAHTRMEYAATVVANIVAKQSGTTTALLADDCRAAQLSMAPYSATPLAMAIVSVTWSYSANAAAVAWQYDAACPTTAPAVTSATALTYATTTFHAYSEVQGDTNTIILVYATYTYTPIVSYVLGGAVTMTHTVSAWTRTGQPVPCTGC
jgi:Flp pilus assembly protein TadG